ncbi:hypothetical protein [Cylindrospermum sp. FACHB-282]|uniref:hypothetical protein n=1 Tax=Cylindrospermum sp. FACHB-282 TaxID=2692794 RepID=UPI0016863D24|nr:hypothetical protein [Cylindrospermum sp. FACHB-282]MBD2384200.1 hypothetical protein [Cylindrospermum sp. FACHB-282]
MKINLQPISERIGQQIININNARILEIDKEAVISLFKSSGVLLFRGFETNADIYNTRILHGRRAFTDVQRDIYIRLGVPGFAF